MIGQVVRCLSLKQGAKRPLLLVAQSMLRRITQTNSGGGGLLLRTRRTREAQHRAALPGRQPVRLEVFDKVRFCVFPYNLNDQAAPGLGIFGRDLDLFDLRKVWMWFVLGVG